MEICSRFTGMERKDGAFLLHTDNANVKVCFVTDEIVRVRASFDHELAEESYVLMTTAWEDRIKLLPDAALYRSTRIHHTPDSYTKRELVGAGPPSILLRKTVRSLKSPTGAFIAALRFANANLSGRAPPSCLRKTVLSLKSPKLWQKERGLDSASPLDKAIIVKKFRTHLHPGFVPVCRMPLQSERSRAIMPL